MKVDLPQPAKHHKYVSGVRAQRGVGEHRDPAIASISSPESAARPMTTVWPAALTTTERRLREACGAEAGKRREQAARRKGGDHPGARRGPLTLATTGRDAACKEFRCN